MPKVAGHVDVYQRSAPYVLPKADRPYRDAEHALYDRLPVIRKADRLRIFLYGELLTSGRWRGEARSASERPLN